MNFAASVQLGPLEIPVIVFGFVIFILIFFLYQLFDLLKRVSSASKRLDSVLSKLEAFKKQAEIGSFKITSIQRGEIGKIFNSDGLLKEAWKEFNETLVALPSSGTLEQNSTPEDVYNTQQAEAFFTQESLADTLNLSWYNSVPGLLTGLGLLGTFTALLIGLAGLSIGKDLQVVGIQDLINGLSGKFVSSIAGLGCSLIFLSFEKLQVDLIENRIIKLQRLINSLFERKPIEQLLVMIRSELMRKPEELTLEKVVDKSIQQVTRLGEIVDFSKQQVTSMSQIAESTKEHTVSLKTLSEEIGEGRLSEALTQIAERAEAQQAALEMLVTDLATRLTDGIQQNVTPELQRMVVAIEKLNETTDALRQQRQESSADTIERLTQSFKESLTGSASNEMQQLGQSLGKAATFLENLDQKNQAMEERMVQIFGNLDSTIRRQEEQALLQAAASQKLMEQMLEQTQTASNQQLTKFQQQIEGVLTQTAQWSSQMQEGFSALIQHLQSTSNTQQTNLQQQVSAISSSMKDLLGRIEANATNSSQTLVQNTRNVLSATGQWVEQVNDRMSKLFEQQQAQVQALTAATQGVQLGVNAFSTVVQQNTAYFERLKQVTSSIENAANSLDRTSGTANESQRQLQQSLVTLQQVLRDNSSLLENSRLIVERQREVYEQIDSQLGRLLEQLTNNLETFTDASRQHLITSLSQFDNHLSDATQLLGNSVTELGDQLEELGTVIAKTNNSNRR